MTAAISVDATSGSHVTLSHTLFAPITTMAKPLGGRSGQKLLFQLSQGGAGSMVVTWDGAYDFSAGLAPPVLKNSPGQTDFLGFIYDAGKEKWVYVARGDHFGVLLPSQNWSASVATVSGTSGRTFP